MKFDGNRYAKKTSEKLLPNTVFETSSLMLNENSGFDMKYQINKVHNLKLAAKTINKVIIEPKETFSFWQLVRWADRHEKYKDGLNLVNGKIVGSYGGGLCQLSNMLFWLFYTRRLLLSSDTDTQLSLSHQQPKICPAVLMLRLTKVG